MRSVCIPFLKGLDKRDFQAISELLRHDGALVPIDSINWPETFLYAPQAAAYLGYDGKFLAISYEVLGYDLRALELEDNAHPWENSCCEFFVEEPSGKEYFNFELVCNGSLLVAKGSGREGRTQLPLDVVGGIWRDGTLERKIYDERDKEFSWGIAILIPLDLICGGGELPDSLRANFYKCANKSAHPHFLSWNPIKTPAPDFHRPEYFGRIVFERP